LQYFNFGFEFIFTFNLGNGTNWQTTIFHIYFFNLIFFLTNFLSNIQILHTNTRCQQERLLGEKQHPSGRFDVKIEPVQHDCPDGAEQRLHRSNLPICPPTHVHKWPLYWTVSFLPQESLQSTRLQFFEYILNFHTFIQLLFIKKYVLIGCLFSIFKFVFYSIKFQQHWYYLLKTFTH